VDSPAWIRDKTVALTGTAAGDDHDFQRREAVSGKTRGRVFFNRRTESTSDIKEDRMKISEDWWSVIAAFVLMVLAWASVLGKAKGMINIPW
jgi:hypothetical protein